MVKLNKVLLFLFFLVISLGTVVATSETGDDMGNKYLVSDFQINIQSNQGSLSGTITANITNQNNGADGDLFYEIKTNPAANHEDVLQSGIIPASDLGQDTVGISDYITNPEQFVDGATYYILVYTNYPEHDNRVSKTTGPCTVTPDIKPE